MITGPAYLGTSIPREPTRRGPFGEAWEVALQPVGRRGKSDFDGTLAYWIIRAPQSHPLWWWYSMTIIHLRPIAGVKPAHIEIPGATHELALIALNPEQPVPNLEEMEAGNFSSLKHLSPPNLIQQFQVPNDAYAWYLGETAVKAIVDGIISPDTDFRSQWEQAIPETAKHLREGVHGVKIQ